MSRLDLELPIGKRTRWYRFWEMVPAFISYSMLLLMVVLSFINPLWASIYLLAMIIMLLVRAAGIAASSIKGRSMMIKAGKVDWAKRLAELESPETALEHHHFSKDTQVHLENLRFIAADPSRYPKPSEIVQAVIIAAYNESYDVIAPTIKSVIATNYNHKQMVIVFAYEERGGPEIHKTAQRLQREFSEHFLAFHITKHPQSLPDEIKGKGPNITYAAQQLVPWLEGQKIDPHNVIITTLDCDNKPHPAYFAYLTYEFIVHENRRHLSFQPLALYFGNLWDAPAPMRVIALGNTFWTIISSVRPHILRNFAAHSQPLDALIEMDFWSKRSIVEDGHQYWRSYFYFDGEYDVVPIHVPVYQDAVTAGSFKATAIAQFKQLRRWAYGASDVPYVATRIFSWRRRTVPLFGALGRFFRLLDSHISLATQAILVSVGGWVPLLVNPEAFRDIAAHNLPDMVSILQRIAMIGLFITIILSLKMLPPRPSHIHRRRTIGMLLQWFLIPITSIAYSAFSSLNAQTHLLFGKYLDTFDVTEKTASKQ